MLERMIIWGVFVLVVLPGCWVKPNAARIFLGFFFMVMGIGFHLVLILVDPRAYDGYATSALIPLYRWIFRELISLNPLLFAVMAAIFEITVGCLMLSKQRYAKLGLVLGSLFLVAITPLTVETLPNALLAVGMGYIATKEFDRSLPELVRAAFGRHVPNIVS